MLKFFQIEGRYPSYKNSIPDRLISCLATQLNDRQQSIDNFNLGSITAKRFRQAIRELLGYKKATLADGERLIKWLMDKIIQEAPTLPQCRMKSYQFFRDHYLEPLSEDTIEHHIRSAIHRFEKQYFSRVFTSIPSHTLKLMDSLLQNESDDSDENDIEKNQENVDIKLRHLKKMSLESN
jgi:hypothetical protein